MIQRLCIITDRYPTKEYPMNTFLDQLVCEFADLGIRCTVIAPYSRIRDIIRKKSYHVPGRYIKKTEKGAEISVYCPKFVFLTGRKIGPFDFAKSYQRAFERALLRTVKKTGEDFDAFYGHFITPAGFGAVKMGKLFGKPSFIAYGECFLDQDSCNFTLQEIRDRIADVSGIVAVSTKNRNELLKHQIASAEIISVFPNAVNGSRFFKTDRQKARETLGFSRDDFITAFLGDFIERKGVLRVSEALKEIDGAKSIFIGGGPQKPDCPGILFCGKLPHDRVADYLNAADVFVLPTLAEGCCNAIIEAMACGLPVISSDLPFNDDILDSTNSIRIDPNNIVQIKEAIKKLYEDTELREDLAAGALKTAAGLTIELRAAGILNFMDYKTKQVER